MAADLLQGGFRQRVSIEDFRDRRQLFDDGIAQLRSLFRQTLRPVRPASYTLTLYVLKFCYCYYMLNYNDLLYRIKNPCSDGLSSKWEPQMPQKTLVDGFNRFRKKFYQADGKGLMDKL